MADAVMCPRCQSACPVPEGTPGDVVRRGNCHYDFTVAAKIDDTGAGTPLRSSLQSRPPSGVDEGHGLPGNVGPYVLKRKLGAGSMGEVWLAYDPTLERDIAVKILPSASSEDPDRLKRFLREARLAAKLDHPHTAAIHQAGTDPLPETGSS